MFANERIPAINSLQTPQRLKTISPCNNLPTTIRTFRDHATPYCRSSYVSRRLGEPTSHHQSMLHRRALVSNSVVAAMAALRATAP